MMKADAVVVILALTPKRRDVTMKLKLKLKRWSLEP